MIGSDVVGKVSNMKNELIRYVDLLETLPVGVRAKVAHDNFARLMSDLAELRRENGLGVNGINLPVDYEFSATWGIK